MIAYAARGNGLREQRAYHIWKSFDRRVQTGMNPKVAIIRLIQIMNDDLCQAVIYYEVFAPSGLHAPLLARVNHHQIHEGFNVVSEALELGVITILCRIWDKRRGTARITEVASRLQKNPDLVSDQAQFAQWQADVDNLQKSNELVALRAFRNVRLAHSNDLNVHDPRTLSNTRKVLCGDACIVLQGTIQIMEGLNYVIGLRYNSDFNQIRHRWEQNAGRFWDAVAR
jgi:AbiU2